MVSKKVLFVIAVIAAIALFSEPASATFSKLRKFRFGKGDVGFSKGCSGIFGHLSKRYKTKSSRFGGLVNIRTPNHFDESMSVFMKITLAFTDVLDISFIPGLGPFLGKMISVLIKYIVCVLGKNNCAICKESQFGVIDISGDLRVVLKRNGLDNCKDRCQGLIKKHSKGVDRGFKRQIVDIVIRLSELLDGNPKKEDLPNVIVLICQIWVIIGNTSSKGTGSDTAGGYLTVVSQYLQDAGYPDITPAQEDTITKCAESTDNEAPDADTAPWIKGDDGAGNTDTNYGSGGDSNKDKDNDQDKNNDNNKDNNNDNNKDNSNDNNKDKNNDNDKDKNKDKNKDTDKDNDKDKNKDTDNDNNKDKNNDNDKDQNKDKNKDTDKDNNKDKNKDTDKDNDKDKNKDTNKGNNKGNNKGKKTRRHRRKGLKKDIGADGLTKCSGKLFGRIKNHGKLKKSTACEKAANLKQPSDFGDFIDMSYIIVQAFAEIFNSSFIPGLGDFIVKIFIVITKICNCVLGSGKYPVCKTDYGWGIVDFANLKAIDIIKKTNLENCQADFDTMIRNGSKGKGKDYYHGAQRKILDSCQTIIDQLKNIKKDTFKQLLIQVSTFGGILGNTYAPTDDGVDFASSYLNTCGTYFPEEGYAAFTPADDTYVTTTINITITQTTVCPWTVEIPSEDDEIEYE